MTETNKYVKCKECGRTLPGPPRKCDVCGGKMTYRDAEVYYTPEGEIPKHKFGKKARSSKSNSSSNSDSTSRFDSISKFAKSSKPSVNSDVNPYSPNKDDSEEKAESFLEWIGLAEDDEEEIKEVVESIELGKSEYDEDYDDGEDEELSKGKKVLEVFGSIVGIIIGIVVLFGNFGGDDFGEDYSSYDTYVNEIRVMDDYKIYATNVNHSYYDEYDSTVGVDFEVSVTNSQNLTVDLEKDLEVVIDGEVYTPIETYVNNDSPDDREGLENDENIYILEPDITYYFYITYQFDQEEWYELEIKHNLGGGIKNRDPEKDIFIEQY